MNFSANSLIECADEIRSKIDNLQDAFHSNWNDSVHESFNTYIEICSSSGKNLSRIVSECENICNNLNKLKIDEKLKEAKDKLKEVEDLLKEANILCQRKL